MAPHSHRGASQPQRSSSSSQSASSQPQRASSQPQRASYSSQSASSQPQRRNFSIKFKIMAVRMYNRNGNKRQTARSLRITRATLSKWINQKVT